MLKQTTYIYLSAICILTIFITVRQYQLQSTQKELLRLQIIHLKQNIENDKLEKEILLKYKQEAQQ